MASSLSYTALSEKLSTDAIEFVGNSQVKLNFSVLTNSGINLNPDISCVKGIVELLQGLAALTSQVNENRILANLPPIEFVTQQLTGTPEAPEFQFIVRVKVDTALFVDSLDDPTE